MLIGTRSYRNFWSLETSFMSENIMRNSSHPSKLDVDLNKSTYSRQYLNTAEVQAALHVRQHDGGELTQWTGCK